MGATGTLGLVGAAVLGACGSSKSAASSSVGGSSGGKAVSLSHYKMAYQLSWLKTVEFAGSYIADAKGLYRANGLDVSLLAGGPNTAVEPIVTQGTALLGQSGLDSTAAAINNGSPLKVLGVLFQKNPFCVVSRASSPIEQPTDMYGKKIGVAAGNLPAWSAFVKLNKLDLTKIDVQPAQFDPTPVATGEFDGQMVFVDNEVIQLRLKGVQVATMLFEDFNYHLGTDCYIAREDSLGNPTKRAAIAAFLEAELKGWEMSLADPNLAATLTVNDYGKDTGLTFQQQLGEMTAQAALISTPFTKAHGLATFDSATTTPWLATLAASGISAHQSMFDPSILTAVYAGRTSL